MLWPYGHYAPARTALGPGGTFVTPGTAYLSDSISSSGECHCSSDSNHFSCGLILAVNQFIA
jgi:hypothetical protein